jgi:hypothetical protein
MALKFPAHPGFIHNKVVVATAILWNLCRRNENLSSKNM